MELALRLAGVPCLDIDVADVRVQGLGNDRAGGYGPIRPVGVLVLVMPFEEYTGIDYVDFSDVGVVDIVNEEGPDSSRWNCFQPAGPVYL